MIEVKDLHKEYEEATALKGVTFNIQDGEVIGLLGPNGAGKTTLMKILSGYLHPTSGSAYINGLNVLDNCNNVQRMIGYLPENAPLYPELTVQSYLQLIADLRQIPKEKQHKALSDAILRVGLQTRLTRLIGSLSKGYRQRVGLAQAMIHNPQLLILDEPTNGLDPTQILEVRNMIKQQSENSTVLVSTHILSEVEATCDRVIIIIQGEVKADARLSDLAASTDARLTVATDDADSIQRSLFQLNGVHDVTVTPGKDSTISFLIHGDSDQDLCPDIFQLAKKENWQVHQLSKQIHTLEAIFNELAVAEGGVK
jgi:ABC-2 type transport system ATP-binding protein